MFFWALHRCAPVRLARLMSSNTVFTCLHAFEHVVFYARNAFSSLLHVVHNSASFKTHLKHCLNFLAISFSVPIPLPPPDSMTKHKSHCFHRIFIYLKSGTDHIELKLVVDVPLYPLGCEPLDLRHLSLPFRSLSTVQAMQNLALIRNEHALS